MADAASKVDLVKIKFPDVMKTKEVKSNSFAVRHSSVGTAAVKIIGEQLDRNSVIIRNLSADNVWIGTYGVIAGTNGNGFPLRQWESVTLTYTIGEIYAITEANTSVVAIIEE